MIPATETSCGATFPPTAEPLPALSPKAAVLFPVSIDAIMIERNVTVARVVDLKDGSLVNEVRLSKNSAKMGYNDAEIVAASADNLTYTVMTNSEVRTFQKNKEVWKQVAGANETFAFVGYDEERETVVVGSLNEEGKMSVKLVNGALEAISFGFEAGTELLFRTKKYVLAVKLDETRSSILVHSIKDRSVINNDIREVTGGNFQVVLSKTH